MYFVLGTALAVTALPSAWPQAMQVRKMTELRQEPAADANVVSHLNINTAVTRLQGRQGAYVQIQTQDNQTGWVRMFDIEASNPAPAPAGSGTGAAKDALRGLTSLFGASSRKTESSETATLGIRGLGAQDIAQALPNPAELATAQSYQASADQAKAFAAQATLQTQTVAELPVPRAPAGNTHSP